MDVSFAGTRQQDDGVAPLAFVLQSRSKEAVAFPGQDDPSDPLNAALDGLGIKAGQVIGLVRKIAGQHAFRKDNPFIRLRSVQRSRHPRLVGRNFLLDAKLNDSDSHDPEAVAVSLTG